MPVTEPRLGISFSCRLGAPLLWRTFNDEVVGSELALMADHGLRLTRSFLCRPNSAPSPPDTIYKVFVASGTSSLSRAGSSRGGMPGWIRRRPDADPLRGAGRRGRIGPGVSVEDDRVVVDSLVHDTGTALTWLVNLVADTLTVTRLGPPQGPCTTCWTAQPSPVPSPCGRSASRVLQQT